jgi:phage repressor protein C with HTH and peptisase S24 domain
MRSSKEILKIITDSRKSKKMSLDELGEKVGLSKAALSRYENGSREFPVNKTEAFAKALNLDPRYLLGINSDDNILSIYDKLEPLRKKRVYSFAEDQLSEQNGYMRSGRSSAAGAPIDGDYEDAQQEIVVRNEVPRGADEVITIAGDSMEPLLMKGSQVFVHYQPVPDDDGQIVIVSIKDVGVTCKKIYREDGKIRLKSINDKYDDMVFPAQDVRVIGKVITQKNKP